MSENSGVQTREEVCLVRACLPKKEGQVCAACVCARAVSVRVHVCISVCV
jgi:hypothetical protein